MASTQQAGQGKHLPEICMDCGNLSFEFKGYFVWQYPKKKFKRLVLCENCNTK